MNVEIICRWINGHYVWAIVCVNCRTADLPFYSEVAVLAARENHNCYIHQEVEGHFIGHTLTILPQLNEEEATLLLAAWRLVTQEDPVTGEAWRNLHAILTKKISAKLDANPEEIADTLMDLLCGLTVLVSNVAGPDGEERNKLSYALATIPLEKGTEQF